MLGGEDRLTGPTEVAVNRARSTIPGVEVTVLAEAGHLMNVEEADAVNGHLLAFLGGAATAAAPGQPTF